MERVIIANIIMGISIVINVFTMQQKEKSRILIGLILVNLFSVFSYTILKSYSGVMVGLIAIVQTYIKFLCDKKNKNIPIYVQILFILTSILGGVFTTENIFDILPIICLVLYTLSILQQKEKYIRLYTLGNIIGWIGYDFYSKAYIGILFSMFTVTSTIIAIIRFDIMKKEKKSSGNS